VKRDRVGILSDLSRQLELQIADLEAQIEALPTTQGLSKSTIADVIERTRGELESTKKLKARAEKLKSNREPAHLFLFQTCFGRPPNAEDPVYLGTDGALWESAKGVNFAPSFVGKQSGAAWHAFHSRAETDEYFSLIVRI
jgi:hypothetical protein